MALLEGRHRRPSSPRVRAQSPAATASPVRSMLDIGGPNVAKWELSSSSSVRGSSRGPVSPPPSSRGLGSPSLNPESAYQFEMMPTIESHSMPKRVAQGGKKKQSRVMSSVYGNSSDILGTTRDRERHSSLSFLGKSKSNSPGPGRSASPGGRMLNTNSLNMVSDPKKFVTDSGKVVDMQSAYRRLSDGALLRSGGALATLPIRKGADPAKGESLAPGGGVRLATDDFGDDEAAVESSEDDDSEASSEGEGWGSKGRRGRRRTRRNDGIEKHSGAKKETKSLLAAAEAEREPCPRISRCNSAKQHAGKEVSSNYSVKSLLEPTINVTGPDGEKMTSKKTGVHPHTNFDQGGSGLSTPIGSDTEADLTELKSELKFAQQLAMNISPIQSTPDAHRCVRQIIRGKWRQFHEDAEKGLRRQRVYLVATDLSEEAAYALEWTIGTVLRDGDTLLAVYAVDEEAGVGAEASGVPIGGGATAQQETDSLMKTLSNPKGLSNERLGPGPSPLQNTVSSSEVDVNTMGKNEKDRYQAAVEVSDRCVKLLRKTRLQVRVVVEVFHCKSPKHMLTEVVSIRGNLTETEAQLTNLQ